MVASLLAIMTVGVAPALAANQVQSTGLSFTGSTNPGVTYTVTGACDACVPDALARAFTGDGGSFAFGASVTTTVDQLGWASPSSVAVAYDDTLLRQGQTLNLSDTLTNNTGSVTASGILSGSYGLFRDPTGGSDFAPTGDTSGFSKNVTWTFACTIPLPGESPRDCTSGAVTTDIADYTLFSVADVADVDVVLKVVVSLDLSVASDGVMTVRKVEVVGGGPNDVAPLTWVGSSPSTVADAEHLSCTQPAGDEVVYHLTTNGAVSPSETLGTTTALTASAVLSPIIGPDVDLFDLGSFASLTTPSAAISFPMTAPDTSVTLGTLAPNNVAVLRQRRHPDPVQRDREQLDLWLPGTAVGFLRRRGGLRPSAVPHLRGGGKLWRDPHGDRCVRSHEHDNVHGQRRRRAAHVGLRDAAIHDPGLWWTDSDLHRRQFHRYLE